MNSDSLEYIMPDTVTVKETVQMPNYIDSIFSMSSKLWHGEVSVSGLGEMGDIIPYSMQNDDFIVITIFACIILTAIFWNLTSGFLTYQFYNILHTPREGGSRLRETERQQKRMWYFGLQWCLLASIFCYSVATKVLHITFPLPSWAVISIYSAIIYLCILMQDIIRGIPHSIYFERKQLRLYHIEHITYMAYYGILILPFVFCSLYVTNDIILLAKILLACLVFVKIIEISKVHSIFFRKNGRFLHFFLYLCTLEAVPILLTVGILTFTTLILTQQW